MPETDQTRTTRQSCGTCRKRKRKCTKELPKCALCIRYDKPCDYSEDLRENQIDRLQRTVTELAGRLETTRSEQRVRGATPSPIPTNLPNPEISEHSQPTAFVSRFPPLFFLDSAAFEYKKYTVEKPFISLPGEYLRYLGNSVQMSTTAEKFFGTVHTWFPIGTNRLLDLTRISKATSC